MGFRDRVSDFAMNWGGKAYLWGKNQDYRNRVIQGSSRAKGSADAGPFDYWDFMEELRGTPLQRALAAETSTWVMRCINYRVNEMHNIEWFMVDKNGERMKNQDDHPFKLLYRQAYEQEEQDIIERWVMMRLCHGMVYFEKFLREDGLPGGGKILNSGFMEQEILNGQTKRYVYKINSENIFYGADELCIDSIYGFLSDIRGKAPLDRAMMNVNIDLYNQRTIRGYLLNDNKPSLILSPNNRHGRGVDQDSLDKLAEKFRDQGKGPEKGWQSKFLSIPMNVFSIDVQKPDTSIADDARKSICVEFGLDPAVMGIAITADPLGASTTLQEKRIITLIDTIKPDLRRFERFVNEKIMPWLTAEMPTRYKNSRFCWDYMSIDTMIKYTEKALEQAREHYKEGIISRDELRRMLFLPEVDGLMAYNKDREMTEEEKALYYEMHPVKAMEADKIRRLYELYSVAGAISREELRSILGFKPEADGDNVLSVDPGRYYLLQEKIDQIEGIVPRELQLARVPAVTEVMCEDAEPMEMAGAEGSIEMAGSSSPPISASLPDSAPSEN